MRLLLCRAVYCLGAPVVKGRLLVSLEPTQHLHIGPCPECVFSSWLWSRHTKQESLTYLEGLSPHRDPQSAGWEELRLKGRTPDRGEISVYTLRQCERAELPVGPDVCGTPRRATCGSATHRGRSETHYPRPPPSFIHSCGKTPTLHGPFIAASIPV